MDVKTAVAVTKVLANATKGFSRDLMIAPSAECLVQGTKEQQIDNQKRVQALLPEMVCDGLQHNSYGYRHEVPTWTFEKKDDGFLASIDVPTMTIFRVSGDGCIRIGMQLFMRKVEEQMLTVVPMCMKNPEEASQMLNDGWRPLLCLVSGCVFDRLPQPQAAEQRTTEE